MMIQAAPLPEATGVGAPTIAYDRQPDGAFHLGRLHRFASVSLEPGVCAVQAKARLARHATVSAFRDCVRLGLEDEARREIARAVDAAIAASSAGRHRRGSTIRAR